MAGIYVHIPFCRTKCRYCDFYSCTSLAKKEKFLEALRVELAYRRGFLSGETVTTIYFGGGTPSLLEPSEISSFLTACREYFTVDPEAEITLELNPDDIRTGYLRELRAEGVNRLSIGIQSFIDRDLERMNRRHSAGQAREAVEAARAAGFDNLTIDLIYGIPGMSETEWEDNLTQAIALNPEHISAYHLTLEPGTPWGRDAGSGRLDPVSEEAGYRQYRRLHHRLEAAGFQHYEISNFARPGFESRHNSNYWKGVSYLGLGPSAHSFRDHVRGWNASDLDAYTAALIREENTGTAPSVPDAETAHFYPTGIGAAPQADHSAGSTLPFHTVETLDEIARYNEYLLTRLRTREGLDEGELGRRFGACKLRYFRDRAERYLQTGIIRKSGARYYLPPEHFFISDGIICDLFYA